jgi:hypothetical protein
MHCSVLLVVFLTASPAHARHTPGQDSTDDTAFVMPPGQVRLGLWKLEVGVTDGVQLGTYVVPWLAWAFDVNLANATVKFRLLERDAFALSLRVNALYVQKDLGDVPFRIWALPMELVASFRRSEAVIIHAGVTGTYMQLSGVYEPEEYGVLQGAVAANSLQAFAMLEYRMSRTTALLVHGRLIGHQTVSGNASGTFMVNERTTVDVAGHASADVPLDLGGNVGGAVHWSWDHLNLRLGASYGNYVVPAINLVIPVTLFIPEIDIYFRF